MKNFSNPKTIGFLVGELIKRVTNKSVGKNLEDLLNHPLKTKCFIGTPLTYHDNIAELISSESLRQAFSNPQNVDEYLITAFLNPANRTKTANTKQWRLAEIPAMNCHTNSRSLARIYDYFLSHSSNKFISPKTFNLLTSVAVSGEDHVMKSPMQWSYAGYSVVEENYLGIVVKRLATPAGVVLWHLAIPRMVLVVLIQ